MSEDQDILRSLSPTQVRMLSSWKFRYKSVDNRTLQALATKGIVEWARPGWSQPHGYWLSTSKGDRIRALIAAAAKPSGEE